MSTAFVREYEIFQRTSSARSVTDLLRSSITAVWLFLVVATITQWALGTDHGGIGDVKVASTIIFVTAYVKIWFIVMYFMEVKEAPPALKAIMTGWCAVFLTLCIGYYFAA